MTTAYAASNSLPMSALPTANGIAQLFRASETNVADATYAPDGLAAAPIFGLGGKPLQGSEIVAGGNVTLVSYIGPLLNSGDLCWVLFDCTGGAQQTAPATKSEHAAQLGQIGHGQCQLSIASATSLVLKPHNGNNVIVNGVPLQIPQAGIAITNAGLAANTMYYLYLGGTTAAPTLAFSTTGHSTAPNGVEVESTNVALSLVGAVVTNDLAQFQNLGPYFGVANWFNRATKTANTSGTTAINFTNVEIAELNTGVRVAIFVWAGDVAQITQAGSFTNSVTLNGVTAQAYANTIACGNAAIFSPPQGGAPAPFVSIGQATRALGDDGMLISMVYGSAGANTGTILFGMQNLISNMI